MSFVYMLMTASVIEDATDDGSNIESNSYGIVLMLRVNKDESNFQFPLKGCIYQGCARLMSRESNLTRL